jgi:hypothetical protein
LQLVTHGIKGTKNCGEENTHEGFPMTIVSDKSTESDVICIGTLKDTRVVKMTEMCSLRVAYFLTMVSSSEL